MLVQIVKGALGPPSHPVGLFRFILPVQLHNHTRGDEVSVAEAKPVGYPERIRADRHSPNNSSSAGLIA